jgi:hypothetical protein
MIPLDPGVGRQRRPSDAIFFFAQAWPAVDGSNRISIIPNDIMVFSVFLFSLKATSLLSDRKWGHERRTLFRAGRHIIS